MSINLPLQLTEEETKKIVRRTVHEIEANDIKDMGRVMGDVMPKVKGKADGVLVSVFAKELLQ